MYIFSKTNTEFKKYTLTCISINKSIHLPALVLKRYTLTSINDKKDQ